VQVTVDRWRGPGWRAYGAHPRHIKAIRDWIARAVASHSCPVDPGIAALAVSELFTNAILHGPSGGLVLVGYCLWGGGVRIVVCDGGGTTIPQLRDPADGEEGGRGLRVVEALSAQWDNFRADGAQIVWCDLGQPLAAPHSDAWAWLAALLVIRPPPPGTQVVARHDGRASPGASPDHGLVTLARAGKRAGRADARQRH
jgi:serine/threonine-protein kinase RsbW